MNTKNRIITFAIALAAGFWVGDAIIDSIFFSHSSLLKSSILEPSPYEIYIRLLGAAYILIPGFIVSRVVARRQQIEKSLRASESFNVSLLENAPNPIVVTNMDSSVRYVNPAFETLTGYSRAEAVGLTSPYPWWPPEMREQFESENITGERMDFHQHERRYRKKSGESFWIVISIRDVRDKDNIAFHIGNWLDITERKRMEELLKVSEQNFRSSLESQ